MLKTILMRMKTRGAIANSSKFLTGNILKKVNFPNAKYIIELGAGDGCMTKEILKRMKHDTKLISFELDKKRFNKLNKINDKRLILVNDNAANLQTHLIKNNINEVDFVISGLPYTLLPQKTVDRILKAVSLIIKPEGKYIEFRYSPIHLKELKGIFSNVDLDFTLINIPPAFVYTCQK